LCATVNFQTIPPISAATSTAASYRRSPRCRSTHATRITSRNSFTASFIDKGSKRDWIETLDTAFGAA